MMEFLETYYQVTVREKRTIETLSLKTSKFRQAERVLGYCSTLVPTVSRLTVLTMVDLV